MANLAAVLRDRYRALNGPDDLDRAAALLGAVLQDDPEHGIDWPRRVLALAGVLADRYQDRGSELDRAEANEADRRGCAAGRDLDPDSALGSADEWGRWADAGGWWQEASEAYAEAVAALLTAAQLQLLREHKQSWLRRGSGITARGAFAMAAAGRERDAVRTQEIGRAVLLAESLEQERADLTGLARRRPDIVARYRQVVEDNRILRGQLLSISRRST
jgi:hypothetical protein